MAKRRRLIPSPLMSQDDAAEPAGPVVLETKAYLRPGLGAPDLGAVAPIARVVAEASAQAALTEMAEAMTRARHEGRLVLAVPLDRIDADHLVRDRLGADEEELSHLMASLRAHGQRTPVEVTELGPERFGLISGWRRLQAFRRLLAETGEPRFAEIQVLLRRPDTARQAYIAMVEENEVRLGLSYYERARIAARAVDLGVFETEKQALQQLFAAASRARRSKIGSFLALYRTMDASLRYPSQIPERLGLALAKALADRPSEAADLAAGLAQDPAPDAAEEQRRLALFAAGKPDVRPPPKAAPHRSEPRPGVFLEVGGGWTKPVLTLSGPAVGPEFRERLEHWLLKGE